MKILLIHHLEMCWESAYNKYGTSFQDLIWQVVEQIEGENYDRIILTLFEDYRLQPCHEPLFPYCVEVHDYAYGWDEDCVPDWETSGEWTEGGTHSEIVWVPQWIRDLAGHDIELCGAFDGECIEDMEIALEAAGVKFTRLNNLIVG